MAIKASFNPATGVLSETGDNLGNTITTSRDAAGQIFVNGGAVSIDGGQPTFANTTEIEVSGGNGNDTISLDNAALPASGKLLPARATAVRRQRQRHPQRRRRQRHPRRRRRQRHGRGR